MTELLIKLFIGKNNTEDSQVRKKYGFLSGITGMALNILLCIGKLAAGVFSGAISVIADALNNLSDAGSSIVNMAAFKIANTPPDREHPFGHGRAEYISGLIISLIIILMGVELFESSFERIFDPQPLKTSLFTIIILFVSAAVKLWLFAFNKKLGEKINSVALRATATDSLSDVLSTTAVIAGMLVCYCFDVNIDGYIGLAVAVFIVFSGLRTAKESLSPLLGQMPDKETVKSIQKYVCGYDRIIGIHDLIIHNYGAGTSFVSFHAEVDSEMVLTEAHELIDKIEKDLREKFNCFVTIHIDPVDVNDRETTELCRKVKEIVEDIDKELSIHDFRVLKSAAKKSVIFDLNLPYNYKLSDIQVKNMVISQIKTMYSDIEVIVCTERQLSELD
ncbi:MAG: cation diffusion facilitator family transporter [Ruminiclostridium sp.]|nr:cation diffusion facilitator family transporter [Ruminiclostridium sp.]